jgi:hypothetical protein
MPSNTKKRPRNVITEGSPITGLRLAHRLYRQFSPLDPAPSRAQLAEELHKLANEITAHQVKQDRLLAVIWPLVLYLFERVFI